MNQTWNDKWQDRISARIVEHGYSDFQTFLAANPLATYGDLAAILGVDDDIVPVQIEAVHVASVSDSQGLREQAIADSLFRRLREALKRGWGKGIRWDSKLAGALANWCGMWEDEPWTRFVIREIFALEPPAGWIPEGPDDPIIRESLRRAAGSG